MAKAETQTRDRAAQSAAPKDAPRDNLPASQGQPPRKENALVAFKAHLDERMNELQFALPSHISPERFQRVALTALQRKPDLLKCTKQSLWNACLLAAQDGLMPDGREGAIVPYGENANGKKQADIATWMPMIEGLRKKARNSGEISDWLAFTVNARDFFEVELGDKPTIIHRPYMGAEDPGSIVAAYSVAWLKDGTISRDVMTIRDILKIKAKSRAANGPWGDATFFPEMCKKTIARRHYKQLPHSSDLDEMIKRDDEAFGLDDRGEAQIEQRQQKRIASTGAAFDQFAGSGSAAFIEHQDSEDQPQDNDHRDEFADDETGQQDQTGGKPEGVQQDGGKQAGAAVEVAGKDLKQTGNAADKTAGAKPAADSKPAGDQQEGKQPGGEDNGGKPSQSAGEETRRWPPGEKPSSAEEYEFYAETAISDFTDADLIAPWWKSKEELDLRKACGVSRTLHDELRDKAANQANTLRKNAKAN